MTKMKKYGLFKIIANLPPLALALYILWQLKNDTLEGVLESLVTPDYVDTAHAELIYLFIFSVVALAWLMLIASAFIAAVSFAVQTVLGALTMILQRRGFAVVFLICDLFYGFLCILGSAYSISYVLSGNYTATLIMLALEIFCMASVILDARMIGENKKDVKENAEIVA